MGVIAYADAPLDNRPFYSERPCYCAHTVAHSFSDLCTRNVTNFLDNIVENKICLN
jgi:hypothetical protein